MEDRAERGLLLVSQLQTVCYLRTSSPDVLHSVPE